MTIEKTQVGNKMTMQLSGRLDTETAPQMEAALKELPHEITDLTLDLKELEYISSAGLRTLLLAQNMMDEKGSMRVLNANEMVMEVFEITGFADILTIQ